MIAHDVGQRLGIEDSDVEAVALISDLGDKIARLETHRDLHVFAAGAVTDGVGRGLLDAEQDLVDHTVLGTVLIQVVTQALASAQEVRGLGGMRKCRRGGADCDFTMPCDN